jgi:predicted nuclease with TOPRIM domain
MKHILSQPGSPFAAVTADEWMDNIMERRELAQKVEELEEKVESLQADLLIALEQEQFVIRDEDIERLADALKPTPKPRAKKAA